MSDERDQREGRRDDELPSVEQVARLDAFLDDLIAERRPAAGELTEQEARERLLATQLRLAREGVETPQPAYLQALEREVGRAVGQEGRRRRRGLSRGGFLRGAATLVGGAGLGVAGVEVAAVVQQTPRPHDLVAAGEGRWYDIAATGEVQPGGVKPFSAGGVLGFLLNDGGRLHAVSAICTHMGCRLKPNAGGAELHCLCHASRFNRRGTVLQGAAPSNLPEIALREENGRVLALGTRETV